MNLILIFPEDFVSNNRVRLEDYRAAHIRDVHRAYVGQVLKVGLANGGLGEGVVTRVGDGDVELEFRLTTGAPAPSDVSLILALPRPQTLKKVLETTAALGVKRLFFIDAERVEKSFFGSKLLKDGAWMRHVRLGLEQGGRTLIPEISFQRSFKSDGISAGSLRLMTHPPVRLAPAKPDASAQVGGRIPILHPEPPIGVTSPQEKLPPEIHVADTLWETPLAKPHGRIEILCALGPEGGWLDAEVETFVSHGFKPISLGPSILRVEYAVTALLSGIELLQGRFLRRGK